MKLYEILDTKIDIAFDNESSNFFNASTLIDNEHYGFDATLKPLTSVTNALYYSNNIKTKSNELIKLETDDIDVWVISFFNMGIGWLNYDLTGKGNSLKVLSFVNQALLQFVKQYHPKYIAFTADSNTRVNVYTKIISKAIKIKNQYKFDADKTDLIVMKV